MGSVFSCVVKQNEEGSVTHSFRLRPWKKLAHSKQVFLLPTQNTDGIPTTSTIRYFMRNRTRSGLLVCSTYTQRWSSSSSSVLWRSWSLPSGSHTLHTHSLQISSTHTQHTIVLQLYYNYFDSFSSDILVSLILLVFQFIFYFWSFHFNVLAIWLFFLFKYLYIDFIKFLF